MDQRTAYVITWICWLGFIATMMIAFTPWWFLLILFWSPEPLND